MHTRTEIMFLFELLAKNKTTKEEQKICKTNHFYRMVSRLKADNLIDSKHANGSNTYFLTDRGWVLINIIGKDKNTPEKYKPFIKEIRVLW